jgi:GDPmannose 4,6-dehydratase
MKVAIITGANGQDGSYLQEFLKNKGYIVKCFNREDDILNFSNVQSCISGEGELEIYNLAAQSHIGVHDRMTFELNTMGLLNILESVKQSGRKCKVFQASSSEIFGNTQEVPQDEQTPYNPITLYGVSKLSAHLLVKQYRENHGLFVCSGILYNHESPRRKDTYVTQKIIEGLKSGECFTLGNIEARRDWGHARDYVEAMWLTLQQERPGDYVIATGVTHSVREFIDIAVHKMGKKIVWSGKGEGRIDGKVIVKVSEEFYRPNDPHSLVGNPKNLESIGWVRKYTLPDIIEEMLFPPSESSPVSSIAK